MPNDSTSPPNSLTGVDTGLTARNASNDTSDTLALAQGSTAPFDTADQCLLGTATTSARGTTYPSGGGGSSEWSSVT